MAPPRTKSASKSGVSCRVRPGRPRLGKRGVGDCSGYSPHKSPTQESREAPGEPHWINFRPTSCTLNTCAAELSAARCARRNLSCESRRRVCAAAARRQPGSPTLHPCGHRVRARRLAWLRRRSQPWPAQQQQQQQAGQQCLSLCLCAFSFPMPCFTLIFERWQASHHEMSSAAHDN